MKKLILAFTSKLFRSKKLTVVSIIFLVVNGLRPFPMVMNEQVLVDDEPFKEIKIYVIVCM